MKKLIYITNIPTPYRNYRFNEMTKCFAEQGIEVEVLYMNASEPDRNWTIDHDDMQHNYHVFSRNKVIYRMGMWMHFSPKLQWYLLTKSYDIAVLGGLASPAHFIASVLLKRKSLRILSVESNLSSIGNKGTIATKVKSLLMRRFDFFQVTGVRAIDFIGHYVPELKPQNIVTLPNVINEPLFHEADPKDLDSKLSDLISKQKAAGNKTILIPARLIDEKGLLPFLSAMKASDKLAVFIAGDGKLKETLDNLIKRNNLNVFMLGGVTPATVAAMMKTVDFLALPSKSDPSPLSVIEAISVGLPLLISKNVGNYEDVLRESENGWGFEFDNKDETRAALIKAAHLNADLHQNMRIKARELFTQNFSTQKVLNRYLDELKRLATHSP